MPKVLYLKGLPGCGKSTYSKKLMDNERNSWKRVNKDDLRAMVDQGHWSRDTEKLILNIQDAIILEALKAGKNVIVDNTNLASKHEQRIRQLTKDLAEFEIKDFTDVPVKTCIERDSKRPNPVGVKVIRDMYNQFLRREIKPPKYDKALRDCIICDLDGTLAFINGRDPYDASTCDKDEINLPLVRLLNAQLAANPKCELLFFSGREDKYRSPTLRFLERTKLNFTGLFMRPTKDGRKDSIVKEEMYNTRIKGNYNVVAVFDDRLQVCEMWHELGLPLFRVGDPNADF